MQVACDACQRSMNIPDEKLPKDQAFSITCPGCKNKIKVDQHLKAPESPTPSEPEEVLDAPSMVVEYEEFEDDDELVIYEEGDQLALVLDEKTSLSGPRRWKAGVIKFNTPNHRNMQYIK